MNSEKAIQWVDKHKAMIVDRAKEYSRYTPYDIDDYLQDAYSAAIEAALCCQRNLKLEFKAVFLTVFRRNIARVTPFPDEAREEARKQKENALALKNGKTVPVANSVADQHLNQDKDEKKKPYHSGGTSMSFPSTAQKDIPIEGLNRNRLHGDRRRIDIEKVYEQRVKPNLTDREREVMELALGISKEGTLNDVEIARKLGVSRNTVLVHRTRALEKVKKINQPINLQEAKSRLKNKINVADSTEKTGQDGWTDNEPAKTVHGEYSD